MSEENKPQELTLKQRRWMDIYLQTGNATEAAMQVYDCKDRDSAGVIGYENLRKLNYEDFLEAAGITDQLLQDKIMEGLQANKQIGALILVDSKGNVSKKENEGMIEVPDNAIRHKYLETALKLKNRLVIRVDHTTLGKELPTPIYGGDKNI